MQYIRSKVRKRINIPFNIIYIMRKASIFVCVALHRKLPRLNCNASYHKEQLQLLRLCLLFI
jgi:hypothetical protein